MKKILFVCLGNICRSPLAEGIMLHLKEQHDLKLQIDSAGTSNYHIGEAPDRRTIANAAKNGVDLSALRARQFQTNDLNEFDHIYVMDKSNLRNVLALAKNDVQRNKVKLFLHSVYDNPDLEVPDPWHGGEKEFEDVFKMIWQACDRLRLQF